MNRRTVLGFIAMAWFSGCLGSCTGDRSTEPPAKQNSAFVMQEEVLHHLSTEKRVYSQGDSIAFTYRVTNLSDQRVTLGWLLPCRFTIRIRQMAELVWVWGRVCGGTLTELALEPRQSSSFEGFWNSMHYNGSEYSRDDDFLAPPGEYTLSVSLFLVGQETNDATVTLPIALK
jgi:hypothetical protein